MSETMSTNSLLLMLAAALVYPPVLKALLDVESRSQVRLRKLWAVTLSFAGGSWLLAYFWAQELRSPAVSIAAIACVMLALPAGYRLFSSRECPKLGWLLMAQIGLLAYAGACWVVMSLSAAATDATVESQTLALGYLLLGPALAWALLPRPQALKAGPFVILGSLLTYAVVAWATLGFWGVAPSFPPRLERPSRFSHGCCCSALAHGLCRGCWRPQAGLP